ncbi:hypothetical protein LINPERHAP1_LOCUS21674, partial [Linum perenne]
RIHLQIEFLLSEEAILADACKVGRHSHAIGSILEWCKRDWEVRISHVFREGNPVADLLAHFRHGLPLDINPNCFLCRDTKHAILCDCIRVGFPRLYFQIN